MIKPNNRHQSKVKISIGMPVYNGGEYIREALDSLLMQTFTNFELIISDNGSTDDTGEICRQYAERDSRVSYFLQSENLGPEKNFVFVFEQAKGEYFMWAASDDRWSISWLEEMISSIDKTNEQSFAFGKLQFMDEKGQQCWHLGNGRIFPFYFSNQWVRLLSYFLYPEAFGKANIIYGLFPRRVLKQCISRGFPSLAYGDVIFMHRVLHRLHLTQVAGAVFNKRVHVGNAGGPLFIGKTYSIRMLMVGIEVFLKLPIHYIRETQDPVLRALMVLMIPIKWLVFVCAALLRRIG